ncbi:MAG: 3',5'-cyclic-nucleotide phosphodiesterase [Myxococcota bacterium]
MELKVLGCHGSETPKHRTTSFLVDDKLAIDAGALTSALSLDEQRKIESVLVSHSHLDHVRDLSTIADNRCQQGGPTLEIVGTPATLAALQAHFFNGKMWPDFSKIDTPCGPTVRYRAIEPEKVSEVSGLKVTPVLVSHTIETAAFVIEGSDGGSLAFSGDTGPTERFWEVLNELPDLRSLLMEVSFPNDQSELATASGHHTPGTLETELQKLDAKDGLPILLYHIKPVFYTQVTKQLAKIKKQDLHILQLGDQFLF